MFGPWVTMNVVPNPRVAARLRSHAASSSLTPCML
jgi:hypothetical protein